MEPFLLLKERALQKLGKQGGVGALKITIHVEIPKELNDEQKTALEAFQAATKEEVRAW